jgi:hypothetical protein
VVPETNCTCPVPSHYVSVCQIPNHAPRVVEQSVQPSYTIQLPDDQVQMLTDFAPTGSLFVRIAGLSGVSAVAMGAYGAHSKYYLTSVNIGGCVLIIPLFNTRQHIHVINHLYLSNSF